MKKYSIRDARNRTNMSVRGLALILGISPATWYNYEKHVKSPSILIASRLAYLAELSLDDIEWGITESDVTGTIEEQ